MSAKDNYLHTSLRILSIIVLIFSMVYVLLLLTSPSPVPVAGSESCNTVCVNLSSEEQVYNPGDRIEFKIEIDPKEYVERVNFSASAFFYDWKLRTIHQHSARGFAPGEPEIIEYPVSLPFFAPPGKYRLELETTNGAESSYAFYLVPGLVHYAWGFSLLAAFVLINLKFDLLFRKSKKAYQNIKKEIELEPIKERQEEEERSKEFGSKHPSLAKIPFIRHVAGWIHKEGWPYTYLLLLLFVVAIGLRIWNLDNLSPVRDEYRHLLVAEKILRGHPLDYTRALPVSYLVAFLFKVFNSTSLFVGRLAPVILGSLTTIPLYFLGRRLNKKVGVFAAFLWVFSPFSIGISRYIREYSLICFLIPIVVLYLLYFLDNMDKLKFNLRSAVKIGVLIALFLPFLPYQEIIGGTYYRPLMIVGVTVLLVYSISFLRVSKITAKKIPLTLILFGLLFFLIYQINFSMLSQGFGFEGNYINLFFESSLSYEQSASQWFMYSGLPLIVLLPLFALPLAFYYKKKNFLAYFLCFWAIIISLTVFLQLIDRNLYARYAYYALPFYILVFASSIVVLVKSANIFEGKKKLVYSCLVLVFLFFVFNPLTAVTTLVNEENGAIDVKTGLRHDKTFELLEFLDERNFSEVEFGEDRVLLTKNPMILYYYYNLTEEECISLKDDYTREDIFDYVAEYEEGWFISDNLRNKLPERNQSVGNKTLVYADGVEGEYGFDVYRW
ncbi:MAG: hypothetical protein R6U44_02110 [Archaeoglobaceae archaeon]